jgi:hypothetical protein
MKKLTSSMLIVGLLAVCSTAQAQSYVYIPTNVAGAGLTHIVPDVPIWYNGTPGGGGYVTNGPVNIVNQFGNTSQGNGNWEPYIGVLGDSTFLVDVLTFADDQTLPPDYCSSQQYGQRTIVNLQPAAGGKAIIRDGFYADAGVPFAGYIDASRGRGNPSRAAGDKRPGGVNYITMAETSAADWPAFLSDNHWINHPGYTNSCDRYATEQTYSLNLGTLVPTPLAKAWDYVNGPVVSDVTPGGGNELSRTGGHAEALDNGNFVIVNDDKMGYLATPESTTFAIITPTGQMVKSNTLVRTSDFWDCMAVFRGGFCVRPSGGTLYFYDNAGNLLGTNLQSSCGLPFDAARGDGTRLVSDIRSDYVYLVGPVTNTAQVAIWDARTFQWVTNAVITDTDPAVHSVDRCGAAVDALNRLCAAYMFSPDPAVFPSKQIAARVMKFDGKNVTFLTPSFFPFVNYENNPTNVLGITTLNPTVAMTTKAICIAAKGTINSTNNPAGGPDTAPETTVYTVISTPLGGTDSVGLTNIVPDMLLWYSTNNYYTNGPITVGAAAPNSTIWDAYDSVVGDSTFLVANVTYANTYAGLGPGVDDESHALVFQPTVGGPPKLSREFCADNGTPYLGVISARKTGNPGRVAGDKRLGAVNYLTAAQCNAGDSFYSGTAFQSNGRWANNANYVGDGRYTVEQVSSLNPATLVQTPLVKVSDFVYGRTSSGSISTDFGDVLGLSDGNYAIIASDGTGQLYSGSTATIVIIRPDGSIVKDSFPVDPSYPSSTQGIWANCAAYRGGFCVRWQATLYFFDNAGNPMGSIAQSSSGVPFGTDRGDQTRLASDIRSHYVYLAGAAPYADGAHSPVYLAVWNADTTNFVTAAIVSDTDPSVHLVQAANVAVDALDRVIVGYNLKPSPAFPNYQVAVRVMKFDGTKITPLTRSFFPFVNHDENGSLGMNTVTPGLAMTTKQICISAKGVVNSTNNPAGGADTPPVTSSSGGLNLYTVINHPAPVELRTTMMITRSGSNVIVSWADPAGLGLTLQKTSPTIQPASWSTVAGVVQVGNTYYSTNAIGANTYFRLVH